MDKMNNIIGQNIKVIRTRYGMTLDKVSQITGVSKSMLGQIERGTSTPTVTTLWKICNGLKVSFSTLMNNDNAEVAILNKKTLPSLKEDEVQALYTFIPFDLSRKFEMYNMEIKSGKSHYSEPHLGSIDEYVYVLSGNVEIHVENKIYKIEKGDMLHFNGNCEHHYVNNSSEAVELMVIIVYQ
ncbi:helix-turn-helix domain-containing protein [Alkaliphilus pronyensis]|uniref:Helix-turn-helix domain-containing protein n=1 Tax=Alkaliphilus pronyensis TaxID=1482732 RepID=A0A6I0F406_9FIRM|nr:XRE family transcriptional regulator [Alkaliphilus pronyensis]KAB3536092.1 helix-turn-helix domain-containing protein [Alkaliphilus pronyensis]